MNKINWELYNKVNNVLPITLCNGEENCLSKIEIDHINLHLQDACDALKYAGEIFAIARERFQKNIKSVD